MLARDSLAERGGLSNLKGDIAGGVACAVLTVPGVTGLGILALSPLGEAYVSHGILAGLYTTIVVPLVVVALGARTPLMYSPRAVLAFLIASIAAQSAVQPASGAPDAADVGKTLAALFLVILLAGLFQAAFGALRLGNLVRYIPSPVMAGFLNAGAILIFFGQTDAMLGFAEHVSPVRIWDHLGQVQPLTLVVGLTTAVAMWYAPRFTTAIPAPAVGLVVGSAAYYLLASLDLGALGPVIGPVPSRIPLPSYLAGFAGLTTDPDRWRLLAVAVSGAFSLAILASLDALLTAKACEDVSGERTDGNRTLFRLGIGNMVVACFGGITSGLNLVGTIASYRAGARTRVALIACALTILVAVLLLPPVIALIPRVVVAGLLTVFSIQLVDRWTVQIVSKMAARRVGHWRRMALDLFVIALVATAAIAFNLIVAVAIGVVVAILSFLLRMSGSVVRRAYRGDAMHSRRTLDPRLMEVVAAQGSETLVLELQGPLFFGTAEDLAKRVDAAMAEAPVSCVILDLNRINEVDSTGARILLQIHERLAREGRHLLLTHLHAGSAVANVLADIGLLSAVTAAKVFHDTDRALEWAEDALIERYAPGTLLVDERPFEAMDVLSGLDTKECDVLRDLLIRRTYAKGEVVFREGDLGRELFLIARGSASVKLRLAGAGRENRLATFSPGTVFGELALLDPGPRSASVEADQELACYILTEKAFDRLRHEHPELAIKLVTNLGRELSRRLRRANRTIYQLEG